MESTDTRRGAGDTCFLAASSLHLAKVTHPNPPCPHLSFIVFWQTLVCPGSGLVPLEVKLSLDSSAEGILVGDKRRRGKRGARTVEDSAHRSSRSRHLSPLIPVSGGFVKHGRFDSAGLAVCSVLGAKRIPSQLARASSSVFVDPVFRSAFR